MNAIVPANFGQVSTKFAGAQVQNDLAAGVQAGFGLIGYKGKVWSIRHRGENQNLLRDDGDGPRNSIEVVILKAAPYISKIWYEQGYVEGSTAAPDCFSPNGIVPDPQSTKKQANSCAACPQNVWGSKLTDAGKKAKACGDSKRMAVVPLGDIKNETYGGPMLLRVPAASLQDLASFGNKMQNLGYPYYAIATRISFDANEAYPKFVFSAIRPLTDEEAELVIDLHKSEEVSRILAEGAELTMANEPEPMQPVNNAFEQPPAAAKPAATTKPTTKPAAAKPAKEEPKPSTTKNVGGFGPVAADTSGGNTQPKPAAAKPAKPAAAKPTPRPAPVIPDEDESVDAALEAVGEEGEVVEQTAIENDLDAELDRLLAGD